MFFKNKPKHDSLIGKNTNLPKDWKIFPDSYGINSSYKVDDGEEFHIHQKSFDRQIKFNGIPSEKINVNEFEDFNGPGSFKRNNKTVEPLTPGVALWKSGMIDYYDKYFSKKKEEEQKELDRMSEILSKLSKHSHLNKEEKKHDYMNFYINREEDNLFEKSKNNFKPFSYTDALKENLQIYKDDTYNNNPTVYINGKEKKVKDLGWYPSYNSYNYDYKPIERNDIVPMTTFEELRKSGGKLPSVDRSNCYMKY